MNIPSNIANHSEAIHPGILQKRCLTEKEAANYIGMSVAYLRADRKNGHLKNRTPGPDYVKLGKSVRYLIEDLNDWLLTHRISRAYQKTNED